MTGRVPPTREILIELRERGLTREDIARRYGVPPATVRRWIRIMHIPRPPRRSPAKKIRERPPRAHDGLTALDRARLVLGPRLIERPGHGYYLDGVPASIDRILAAAHR